MHSTPVFHVRPIPGRLVRDPLTRVALDEQGGEVPDLPYWRRRIAAGDVEIVQPDRADKAKKAAKSPKQD